MPPEAHHSLTYLLKKEETYKISYAGLKLGIIAKAIYEADGDRKLEELADIHSQA